MDHTYVSIQIHLELRTDKFKYYTNLLVVIFISSQNRQGQKLCYISMYIKGVFVQKATKVTKFQGQLLCLVVFSLVYVKQCSRHVQCFIIFQFVMGKQCTIYILFTFCIQFAMWETVLKICIILTFCFQFAMCETVLTTVYDMFPVFFQGWKRKAVFKALYFVVLFFISLPFAARVRH